MNSRRSWLGYVFIAATAISTATIAQQAQQKQTEPPVSREQLANLESLSQVFRSVAKRVTPTVVQITAIVQAEKPKGNRAVPEGLDNLPAPYREFFKDFRGQEPREPSPQYGQGSGVIVDAENGYILTNNHVVGGEAKAGEKENVRLDVKLQDGRKLRATIVGQDPNTDIALIRLDEGELKQLKKDKVELQAIVIGDSEKMEVGDWVLAVGAPFGLAQTVTQGIISATGRSMVGIVGIEDFIQTDAAINPGNSGGPLVNMQGQLIGINTAIATSGMSRGYMGIGFAIPTAMVKQVLPDLKAGRAIVRGYLGVQIQGLDEQPGLAQTFGLKEDRGVLIQDVGADTPAGKAGLKPEDIVLSIDGKPVESVTHLKSLVVQTKPGEKLDLEVWRDGKKITIPVEIEAQPDDFYAEGIKGLRERGPDGGSETKEVRIESVGLTVAAATPELAQKYRLDFDEVKGQVIVTEVDPLGEAGALRITPGDSILSVQGERIKSPSALQKALSPEALEGGVRLRVRTDSGTRTLLLQVSQ